MKKFFITLAIALGFSIAASAQPKAVGGSPFFGYGLEISYQHYLGAPHFLEVDFDLNPFYKEVGFGFGATYNWVFAQPAWTPRGAWQWYAGPGIALGATSEYEYDTEHYYDGNKFFFGIQAQVGLSYEFWFPLQLSVDLRPMLVGFSNSKYYTSGLINGFIPTLSARYSF